MKKTFFFFVLAFLPFPSLLGQESVEKILTAGSKETIIREIDSSQWIIYSIPTSSGSPTFSRVSNTSSTVTEIILPYPLVSVTDFDIFEKMVYFCGYDTTAMPVVGYFNYTATSNPQIEYFHVSDVNCLRNIKFLPVQLKEQLVLIGDQLSGHSSQLIHAIKTLSGWDVYNIILETIQYGGYSFHDDMTITDKYVILTSRNATVRNSSSAADTCTEAITRSYEVGWIWYVDYLSAAGSPLTTANVKYRSLSYTVSFPFLIDKRMADEFVTATIGSYTHNGSKRVGLIASKYNVFNCIDDKMVNCPVDELSLVDMCCERSSFNTESLLHSTNGESILVSINPSAPYTNTHGHLFSSDYIIHSLIHRTDTYFDYIASGFYQIDPYQLPLFKYDRIHWGNCSTKKSYPSSPLVNEFPGTDGFKQYTHSVSKITIVKGTVNTTTKGIICEYSKEQ